MHCENSWREEGDIKGKEHERSSMKPRKGNLKGEKVQRWKSRRAANKVDSIFFGQKVEWVKNNVKGEQQEDPYLTTDNRF